MSIQVTKRPWEIIRQTDLVKKVGQIPCIIHQTWKNNNIPHEWTVSQKEWKRYHPDWIYVLWTDKDIFDYISQFHPRFIELFMSFPYGIQKADAIRYFILHDFGGLYSDLDLAPVKNVQEYFEGGMPLYFLFSPNVNVFTNFLMASSPEQPIWKTIWKRLLHPQLPSWVIGKHLEVMYTTGPAMVSDIVMHYPNTIGFLPRSVFAPVDVSGDYGKYTGGQAGVIMLQGQSWNSFDSVIFNFVYKHRYRFIVVCVLLAMFAIYIITRRVVRKVSKVGSMDAIVDHPKIKMIQRKSIKN
jgi:inositol phosphorylceramide mannosyltransferase catalytic subunit